MKNYLLLLLIPFLSSCSDYEFKQTEEFNLQPNALKSGTEVELVHFSGGPENNEDHEFYYQYIIHPIDIDDTIRVLSEEWHNFDELKKGGKVIFYYSDGNNNPRQMINAVILDSIENNTINYKTINPKVCVHKDYRDFETHSFSTTIGNFAVEADSKIHKEHTIY